ncbi:ABC transporter permease [Rhodoferax sp. GW822-FHT02A01]|uniref:ABC transporter permease n=1 Tax=Rhodoferax sp. GW822-FHT02A01 TaxID=3141537 RepID=UPI00315D50F5
MVRPAPTYRAAATLVLLVAVPLVWSLWQALLAGCDGAAWATLWADPQTGRALALSLWTGLASTTLATATAAWMLAGCSMGQNLQRLIGRQSWMLALPHAAFAIGLALLVAPSGWLLRLFSPWATGLQSPPDWPTTQDPWGLGLIAVLAFKETPFLLWAAGAHLLRPDVAQRLQQELQVAATLGYPARSAWWRIVWPQLLARLTAPLLAVLTYGLCVVDVALVIGPASPPTLAVLAWQWLLDADLQTNAKGASAAWLLVATLAVVTGVAMYLHRMPLWRVRRTRGAPDSSRLRNTTRHSPHLTGGDFWLRGIYVLVALALLLASVSGVWPFPQLVPTQWSLSAWRSVAQSTDTLGTTVWLAAGSALAALLWVVAWLELAPMRWQHRLQGLTLLPLVLPALLWVLGLHRLTLSWSLDGTAWGLWLAHWLACLPYVLLTLQGPYNGFDTRLYQLSATLGHGRWEFMLRIKWPLLRASLAAALAVGFAVSVAQYLPTLYVGAGRFATVTTEAVALAAGGQRGLMAAYAALQFLLPAAVFALATRLGRQRHFAPAPRALGTIAP